MSILLLTEQLLNGLQLGLALFLVAAGLTLSFGVMNLVNLSQGSLYMVGAYVATSAALASGSFVIGIFTGIAASSLLALLLEVTAFRRLYTKDHLSHVLGTFGLVIFFNELIKVLYGPGTIYSGIPTFLDFRVSLFGDLEYPAYRLAIIVAGLMAGLGLHLFIARTRTGVWIRAGASDRVMVGLLGINIARVNAVVFALSGALSGLAGAMMAPITAVQIGMGEVNLILIFVVVVIGGVGSIRGAFLGALLVALVDTFGRVGLRSLLGLVLDTNLADGASPALASMSVYVLMAIVLLWRPYGLFGRAAK